MSKSVKERVKESIDILRYDEQKAFKLSFELTTILSKDADFAEEFIESDGLNVLVGLLKTTKGAFQGYVLSAVRALLLYVNAIEEVSQSPDLVERLYLLLGDTKNLNVSKQTLEIFIVLVGMLPEGHKLVNKAAKTKRGEVMPYQYVSKLLVSPDLLVARNSLTFLNILLTKRKEASDKKWKKLVFRLGQGGVMQMVKSLVTVEDETIKKQLTVFQKLTGVTIPLSFGAAEKWKGQYEDMKKQFDVVSESLFVMQQQQPKIRVLKQELVRAQETVQALSLVYKTSPNFHPTKRADGGASDFGGTATMEPIGHTVEDPTITTLRNHIFQRIVTGDEYKGQLAKLGYGPAKNATGKKDILAGLDDEDDDDGPPVKGGKKVKALADDDDDDDDAPPPDDDDDAPPPSDDDDVPPPSDSGESDTDVASGAPKVPKKTKNSKGTKNVKGVGKGDNKGDKDTKAVDGSPAVAVGGTGATHIDPAINNPTTEVAPALVPNLVSQTPVPPSVPVWVPQAPVAGTGWTQPTVASAGPPAVYYKGPAPTQKMRPFHWDKFKIENDKAFWNRVHNGEINCKYNYEEFENMFSQKILEKKEKKAEIVKIVLMTDKKFQNISIMLHKMPKIPQIQRGVIDLNDEIIPKDSLEAMIAQVPNRADPADPDIKMWDTEKDKKPITEYEPPEQFFAMVMATTEFQKRCQAWLFTRDWADTMSNVMKPIDRLAIAVQCVRSSKHLPLIMGIILGFGNMMNHGNAQKGNAPGFHYNTLNKLDAAKDKSGKVSMFQYLITTIQINSEAALDFGEEVKDVLNNVTSIKSDDIDKSVKDATDALGRFRMQVKTVKEKLEKEGASRDDVFIVRMTSFHTQAENQLKSLQETQTLLKNNFLDILEWWSCPARMLKDPKPEEFFLEFVPFVTKFRSLTAEFFKEKKKLAKRGLKLGGDVKAAAGGQDVMDAIVTSLQEKLVTG